jgi:hypothetical protein
VILEVVEVPYVSKSRRTGAKPSDRMRKNLDKIEDKLSGLDLDGRPGSKKISIELGKEKVIAREKRSLADSAEEVLEGVGSDGEVFVEEEFEGSEEEEVGEESVVGDGVENPKKFLAGEMVEGVRTVVSKAKENANVQVEETMSEIVSEVVLTGKTSKVLEKVPDLPPVNPNVEGNPIGYVKSYLSMGENLTVKRLLKARGTMANRGDIVDAIVEITLPDQGRIAVKAVEQVVVGIKAKQVIAPQDAKVKKSKYAVSIY